MKSCEADCVKKFVEGMNAMGYSVGVELKETHMDKSTLTPSTRIDISLYKEKPKSDGWPCTDVSVAFRMNADISQVLGG